VGGQCGAIGRGTHLGDLSLSWRYGVKLSSLDMFSEDISVAWLIFISIFIVIIGVVVVVAVVQFGH
jgi:hypothetical protein